MLGRDKGIYQTEGIDLQMVLVTSPVQVTALTTADIDFSGAQSQVMAGAARGLPVKVIGFHYHEAFLLAYGEAGTKIHVRAQRKNHRHHRYRFVYGYACARS